MRLLPLRTADGTRDASRFAAPVAPVLAPASRALAPVVAALVLAAALLASCAASPSSRGVTSNGGAGATPLRDDPALLSGTLDNGMSWKVLENREPANRLYLRLAVKAGSALEADDQLGIAHLVEHMAFNGTARFPRKDLVGYFESIGMAFGPEVNAYTSFGETVYMLEIPADDPAVLDRSLAVLADWAHAVSFDESELDRERSVVVEEWRLGRGAQGRVRDRQIPLLFRGSRYANRKPIGDPEIIKTIPRARVVDFYRDWYRPELMSVLVVGDAEASRVAEAIKRELGSVPKSSTPARLPAFPVPVDGERVAQITRDAELRYVTMQILEPSPTEPLRTKEGLRRELVDSIAYSILNARLAEKTLEPNPSVLAAEIGAWRFEGKTLYTTYALVPAAGRFTDAFDVIMTELARVERFGVTSGELERGKAELLADARRQWLEREKIHSSGKAASLLSSWLSGEAFLSIEDRHDLYNELIPGIGVEDIGRSVDAWFTDKGKLITLSAPESAADVPSEAELTALWLGWAPPGDLAPYGEEDLSRPLYPPRAADKASLLAASNSSAIRGERELAKAGVREWTLSNGAKVVFLPTAHKANEILFTAFSRGGSSLVTEEDYPSAAYAVDFIESSGLNGFAPVSLSRKLAGKTVSCSPWIQDGFEGLSGSSSVEDLETLFQLINLYFTAPDATDAGWASLVAQLETMARSRDADPNARFGDLKTKLVWGDSARKAPLTLSFIESMDRAKAEAVYRERFSDAGDFTFVFTGSFNEETLRGLSISYLGILPGRGAREEARAVLPRFPAGVVTGEVRAGLENKASVYLAFGGPTAIESRDYELYNVFLMLLDLRLREAVREDLGGTYGVQVSGNLSGYPEGRYLLEIEFGCEPGREDELTKAVLSTLDEVRQTGAKEEDLTKLKETFKRSWETGLKSNGFWHTRVTRSMTRSIPFSELDDLDGVVSRITSERMAALARRYARIENRVEARLLPSLEATGSPPTSR